MNNQLETATANAINGATSAIQAASKALGQLAPRAWEEAVRFQVIDAVSDLSKIIIIGILLTVVACLLVKFSQTPNPYKEDNRYEYNKHTDAKHRRSDAFWVGVVVAAIALLFLVLGIPPEIHRIMQPEYFAAQAIIERVIK